MGEAYDCHLELKLLGPDEVCLDPRCGRIVRDHRAYVGRTNRNVAPAAAGEVAVDEVAKLREDLASALEANRIISAKTDELRTRIAHLQNPLLLAIDHRDLAACRPIVVDAYDAGAHLRRVDALRLIDDLVEARSIIARRDAIHRTKPEEALDRGTIRGVAEDGGFVHSADVLRMLDDLVASEKSRDEAHGLLDEIAERLRLDGRVSEALCVLLEQARVVVSICGVKAQPPSPLDPIARALECEATIDDILSTIGRAERNATPMTNPCVPETVDHPRHYNAHPSGVECIDVVEHLGFNVGNAIKYLWRAGQKGSAIEDLRKAKWYVARELWGSQRRAQSLDEGLVRAFVDAETNIVIASIVDGLVSYALRGQQTLAPTLSLLDTEIESRRS